MLESTHRVLKLVEDMAWLSATLLRITQELEEAHVLYELDTEVAFGFGASFDIYETKKGTTTYLKVYLDDNDGRSVYINGTGMTDGPDFTKSIRRGIATLIRAHKREEKSEVKTWPKQST